MSWHFLQGQVAVSWGQKSSDGIPSALSKLIPTVDRSSSPDSEMECLIGSLSGMTCKRSIAIRGRGRSISSQADSPANRSAQPPVAERLLRIAGQICSASSGKFSHGECLRRMCRESLSSSRQSTCKTSVTWFAVAEHPPADWVPHTDDLAIGYLPTLTTRNNQLSPSMMKWPAYRRLALVAGEKLHLGISFWEWMMGWPVGWTGLLPLETDKYQEWLHSWVEYLKEN